MRLNGFVSLISLLIMFIPIASHAQEIVNGQVTAVDPIKKTVTVEDADQATKTFKAASSAAYVVMSEGRLSDVKVGGAIAVMGQPSATNGRKIDALSVAVLPPSGTDGLDIKPGTITGAVKTVTPILTIVTPQGQTYTLDTSAMQGVVLFKPGTFTDITTDTSVMAHVINGEAVRIKIAPIPAAVLAIAKGLKTALGGNSTDAGAATASEQIPGVNYVPEEKVDAVYDGASVADMYKALGKPNLKKADVHNMTDYFYLIQGGGMVVYLFDETQTKCGSRMQIPEGAEHETSGWAGSSNILKMSEDQFGLLTKKVTNQIRAGAR